MNGPGRINKPPKTTAPEKREYQQVTGMVSIPGQEPYEAHLVGVPYPDEVTGQMVAPLKTQEGETVREVTIPWRHFTPHEAVVIADEDIGTRPEGETNLPEATRRAPEPPANLPTSSKPIEFDPKSWGATEEPEVALGSMRDKAYEAASAVAVRADELVARVKERLTAARTREVDPQLAETPREQKRVLGSLIESYRKILGRNGSDQELAPVSPEEAAQLKARSEEASAVRKALQEEKLAKDLRLNTKRTELEAARTARTDAFTAYLRKEQEFKKFRIGKPKDEEKLAFAAEKRKYLEADARMREAEVAFGAGLDAALKRRLQGKQYDEEKSEAVMKRYNRMVRLREIVKPAVEAENAARLEVAGEKSRNLFGSVLKMYQNTNQKMERGIADWFRGRGADEETALRAAQITARAVRLVGFAAVGSAVGTGAAFVGGGAAALTTGAILGKVGIGLSGIFGGATAGWAYGARFMQTKGALRAEAFDQSLAQNMDSADAIAAQKQAFREGSQGALIQARATRENIVASLTGLGVSTLSFATNPNTIEALRGAYSAAKQLVSEGVVTQARNLAEMLPDMATTESTPAPAESGTVTQLPFAADGEAPEVQASAPAAEAPAPTTEAPSAGAPVPAPEAPGASAPEVVPASLSIGGEINNADRLVGHFGVQLAEKYPNASEAPRSVQTLLTLLTTKEGESLLLGEDAATIALGFQGPNGLSAIMQPGDVIRLSDSGEIVFERPGSPELTQTLINAQGEIVKASERVAGETGLVMRIPGAAPVPAEASAAPLEAQAPETASGDTPAPEVPRQPTEVSAPVEPRAASAMPEAVAETPVVEAVATEAVPQQPAGEGEPPVTLRELRENLAAILETSPQSGEPFYNSYNVEVRPSENWLYGWRMPGAAAEQLYAYGPDAQATAERYVELHPAATVLFEYVDVNDAGVEVREIRAVTHNPGGRPEITPARDERDRPIPPANPNDFSRRVIP